MTAFRTSLLYSLMLVLVVACAATAADKGTTTIEISKLHCAGCAKRVSKKLQAVANVASADVDLKTSQATVRANKDKQVSAKALWEAVEATGYTPMKLTSADASYTSKPKS